jgi:fibronectin type 3 domain-containing protein
MSTRSIMRYLILATALLAPACGELTPELSSTAQDIDGPSDVTATAVSNTQIAMSFDAVASAAKYYIFQQTGGTGSFDFVGTVLDTGAASYTRTIANLQPATPYSYQVVTASTDGSESAPSSPPVSATTLSVAPGAPTNVTATPAPNPHLQIDLTWTPFPTATKVFVYESQAGSDFFFRATVVAPGAAYSATNLLPSTAYCFQLVSTLPDGSLSGPSAPPTCATTPDGSNAPSGVTAVADTSTTIQLQWNAVENADSYDVYRSVAGGQFQLRILLNGTSATDDFLTPNTSYCYRVTGVFFPGTETTPSTPACTTTPVAVTAD